MVPHQTLVMTLKSETCQLVPHTPGLQGKRILVVGYRKPVIDVLERLNIPYAVWHNQPIRRKLNCLRSCSQAFPPRAADIRRHVDQEFSGLGPFTDVIAGTEASVYVASVCRRAAGARKSKDSIALRCSDKLQMKSLMKQHNIPMTDFVTPADALSPQDVFDRLGPKIVVKQRKGSGGRGLTIARNVEALTARTDRGLLFERFVDAHEMSIETFVRGGEIHFTSTTNYLVKKHVNIVPANIPGEILEKAHAINRQVIAALNLDWGLTHAEYYWDHETVLFGEIALRPPGGYIMECMALAHQFDAWEAFVANEIDVPCSFPTGSCGTAGVAILHAGAGTIQAILGDDQARQLPSCLGLKLLVKPGDRVAARTGVGEVSAYGLFLSESQQSTTADVLKCLEMVQFELENPSPVE